MQAESSGSLDQNVAAESNLSSSSSGMTVEGLLAKLIRRSSGSISTDAVLAWYYGGEDQTEDVEAEQGDGPHDASQEAGTGMSRPREMPGSSSPNMSSESSSATATPGGDW